MKATRTIPARPVNDGETVARKIVDLVTQTLKRGPHLDAKAIRGELDAARAALALLAVGGHLRRGELILITPGLRLQIDVPTGEEALRASENPAPPRGASNAESWCLHLPTPDSLAEIVNAVARSCAHVSVEPAPVAERQKKSLAETVDLTALTRMGHRP